MFRFSYDTIPRLRWIALSSVLFLCLSAGAQDEYDSTVFVPDSLFAAPAIPEMANADTTFYFDAPGAAERMPVTQRQVPDSALNRLFRDDAFWYANAKVNREIPKMKPSFMDNLVRQEWFRTLLWVIIVGSFSFIIMWFLIVSNKGLFRRKPASTRDQEDEVPTEDIFALDFEKEIRKAVEAKNFRFAIRMMYLQVLKTLSDKNIIAYKQERTNSDYVQQLWNTPHYLAFFRLTRHFEYAWYGQLTVTEPAFEQVKNDFTTFNRQL